MVRLSKLLGMLIAITACTATVEPIPTETRIYRLATSSSLESMVVSWVSAYASEFSYPEDLFLEILSAASVISATEGGEVDMAILAQDPAPGWFATPLARVAIVVILHPENEIVNLSLDDLSDLFSGRIQSWDSLEVPFGEVIPVVPIPGDPIRERFSLLVMKEQSFSPRASLAATPEAMLHKVSENPGSIGFLLSTMATDQMSISRINGLLPSTSIQPSGEYPLWVDVIAAAPSEPEGTLRHFLAWLQSKE